MVASKIFATLALLPLTSSQADGNPHNWDRARRCDHTDYNPPCGPCEGIGGYAASDEANDYTPPSCKVEGPFDESTRKRPVWGPDFTERKSHEILIGKKTDPACFQAFPSNDSTAENCYKPQEVQIFSEMNNYRALILTANQAGNAWGVAGNVSSVIYHQGPNMWIVNVLGRLGLVNQCVCTSPREGGDPAKPEVGPVQYNWVDNLFYVSTETIGVEYGVGELMLDHWAFGPHHAWTDPETGIIVRMWQPFNGLQIFEPGAWSEGHAVDDAVVDGWFGSKNRLFDQIATDGSKAPDWCTKDAPLNTFRIKCQDNGFPQTSSDEVVTHMDMAKSPVGHQKAEASDLRRAKSKVPRDEFKGEGFEAMSATLNEYLLRHAPNSKECDQWTVEELQDLQLSLLMLRDPELNDVYHDMNDRRRINKDVEQLVGEWEELNRKASTDPQLAKAHRDGHCHEAVMWYVHHLPEGMKQILSSKISLPLLASMQHDLQDSTKVHSEEIHQAYQEKVSCASCHSFTYPSTVTV